MTDKMREEFEAAWAEAMRGDDPAPGRKPLRSQIEPERYRGDAANFAWRWWQASREALVIELPQIVGYEAGYDSIRENEYASQSGELFDADEVFALCRSIEVREAIEAAGVKVKP
ncbi:hypothetical protein [Pseudomonas sp.]|uniref:hypothetical protein n=1 Tax=Pseudomonas sp. TaxID=306 RepID=UPI003FD7FDA8